MRSFVPVVQRLICLCQTEPAIKNCTVTKVERKKKRKRNAEGSIPISLKAWISFLMLHKQT